MIQFVPVIFAGLGSFFHQRPVNGDIAVFIGGRSASCAGNAVIIFLAHDGSLERAHQLHMKLIVIPLSVVLLNRGILSILIKYKLEFQCLIALSRNRDNIAALQGIRSRAAEVIDCKHQAVIFYIRVICAASGRFNIFHFPGHAIHRHRGDRGNITRCIFKRKIPVVCVHDSGIIRNFDLAE